MMKNKVMKQTNSENQAKQGAAEKPVKQDLATAFEKPVTYIRGELKHLRAFHSGEWWLNVDYVDYIDSRSAF